MDKYWSLRGYQNEVGIFTQMPGRKQRDKVQLMLQFFAEQFEPGKTYNEIEVNEILNRYHNFNDPALLRRLLYGSGLLNRTRDGRKYWLENTVEQPT